MDKENLEPVLNNSDDISLKELILKIQEWWRFLLSKWKIILITCIIGGALGLNHAYSKRPLYTAQLSFALEDDKSSGGLGAAAGLASQFGIDVGNGGGGAFSGDNLLELMKSRLIIENTLLTSVDIKGKKQTLAECYIFYNKLRDGWSKKPELRNIRFLPGADRSTFTLQQDSVLGDFYNSIVKNNLTVGKIDKKLSIITINVNSEDQLFAKNFTEVLAKTVSKFYVDTKTKKSVQNVNILQRQADSVRSSLNSAINGVASSTDNNPNANPGLQILRAPVQRHQVDVQANTVILTELVRNLEVSKISLRKETPLIQVIDKPILPLDKTQLSKRNWLLIGWLLSGFLISLFLICRKILVDILKRN